VQAAEVTTREIDVAVHDLLGAALDRACDVLQKRRTDLEAAWSFRSRDASPAILPAKTPVVRCAVS